LLTPSKAKGIFGDQILYTGDGLYTDLMSMKERTKWKAAFINE